MLEYDHHKQKLEDRSPLLFRRSDFTALYSERGLIFVIGGNDEKVSIQHVKNMTFKMTHGAE